MIESGPNRQQREAEAQAIDKEIKVLEQELENGWNMNNWQRNEKKKKIQGLMIQRNKLLKR